MAASLYDPRYDAVRQALVQARRARGVTQGFVASRLGVGQPFVSKMERGEAFIDVLVFVDWCRCLAIDPAAVLRSVPLPNEPGPG